MSKEDDDKLLAEAKRGRLLTFVSAGLAITFNAVSGVIDLVHGDQPFNLAILGICLGGLSIVFFMNHGPNPLRWWKGVWGTEIILDYDRRGNLTIEDRQKFMEEVEEWTRTQLGPYDSVKVNPWRYHFRRKRDAMLFKMTWL